MATTGVFNASAVKIYLDSVAIAYSRSGSLSVNRAEIDVTTKDSANWKSTLLAMKDWSVSCDGVVALDSSANISDLFEKLDDGTQVALNFSSNVSGDKYFHGNAYITSLTYDAPMEDVASFSCTFVGDGALTESTKT